MRLQARIALVRDLYWPAVMAAMGVAALVGLAAGASAWLLPLVGFVGIGFTAAWRPLSRRAMSRMLVRHYDALDQARLLDDRAAVQRWYDELEEYARVFAGANTRFLDHARAFVAMHEERWHDAYALLRRVDRERLPAAARAVHDNTTAWCLAHAGAGAEAVTLAEAALAAADDQLRPYCQGTLGIALFYDGRFADAARALERAIEHGGPAWAQAVRYHYLGEARAAISRFDEARSAWERAVAAAPRSRWGRRAAERLAAPSPGAYR
jgi:tetratricopeptide (TPR) repeat protein